MEPKNFRVAFQSFGTLMGIERGARDCSGDGQRAGIAFSVAKPTKATARSAMDASCKSPMWKN